MSQYPIYTEIVPRSRFRRGKIGGVNRCFQRYSTSVVFTSVTHSSPSLTASLAILVLNGHHVPRFQKSGHVLGSGPLSRPHSPVPQILYWSQTERLSWSLDCLSSNLGRPSTLRLFLGADLLRCGAEAAVRKPRVTRVITHIRNSRSLPGVRVCGKHPRSKGTVKGPSAQNTLSEGPAGPR